MKNILFLLLAFASISSESFAVDKIYNIGFTTAIMADDTEWTCFVKTESNNLVHMNRKYILGNSKHFQSLIFLFYDGENFINFDELLKNYALKTNTIITKVSKKTETDTKTGSINYFSEYEFYNGTSSGYIHFASMVFENHRFTIVKKIDSKLLDESARNSLYQSVHDLITPLYNSKALNLWLESIENKENGY